MGIIINSHRTASKEVIRLDFEGTNGSTTILDSTSRHSPTVVGACTISTAQSRFGSSSLRLPGASGDFGQTDTSDSMDFYIPASTNYNLNISFRPDVVSQFHPLVQLRTAAGTALAHITFTSLGAIQFSGWSDTTLTTSNGILSALTWYDIQIIRTGTTTEFFLNGSSLGTRASVNLVGHVSGALFYIGRDSGSSRAKGYMDRFVLEKG